MALRKGQVYLATHDGEGNSLSNAQRSFISFIWGGRKIEDFGFIATIDGDRMSGNLYSEFEDLTTDYDIVDGQIFWGTHYNPNGLSFTLSTDGVTEPTLQHFRNWFKAGVTRDLILSSNHNRAISARVASAPTYALLPFEEDTIVKIGNVAHSVKTTLWKGAITLAFAMEDPFWHSIDSIFSGNNLTEDDYKAILEDGIPHIDMFNINDAPYLLANNQIVVQETPEGQSASVLTIKTNEEVNTTVSIEQPAYLYYCGTGKCYPAIHFTCSYIIDEPANADDNSPHTRLISLALPEIDQYANIMISGDKCPEPDEWEAAVNMGDDYGQLGNTSATTPTNNESNSNVTTQYITQDFSSKMQFTLPGIMSAYNQAIKIITQDFQAGDSAIELRDALINSISDYYVRSLAVGICQAALTDEMGICDTSTSKLEQGYDNAIITILKKLFLGPSTNPPSTFTATYDIDSLTGQAKMTINLYLVEITGVHNQQFNVTTTSSVIIENVGDMIRSNYLIIDSRNLPDNGVIGKDNCLKLSSNCTLSNVRLNYKYKYLG